MAKTELKEIKTLNDIKQGDTLIITGDNLKHAPVEVSAVKVTKKDGTEIVFEDNGFRFFNLGLYLQNRSWVKHCVILVKGSEA